VLVSCEALGGLTGGLPRPEARVVGARFTGFELDAVRLNLDVEIDNPYSADLPIVGIDLVLSGSDDPILEADLEPGAPIPAGSSEVVEVPVRVAFVRVLEAVQGLEPGGATPYRADVTLAFDAPVVGPVEIPVRHEGELWVPEPPAVRVDRIDLDELSSTRVRANVVLAIESDNQVALPIRRLDYGLQLAGVPVAAAAAEPGVQLSARGATELTIPIETSPIGAGRALFRALSSGQVDYALEGGLELGTPFGPWSVPVRLSGRAPLDSSE